MPGEMEALTEFPSLGTKECSRERRRRAVKRKDTFPQHP